MRIKKNDTPEKNDPLSNNKGIVEILSQIHIDVMAKTDAGISTTSKNSLLPPKEPPSLKEKKRWESGIEEKKSESEKRFYKYLTDDAADIETSFDLDIISLQGQSAKNIPAENPTTSLASNEGYLSTDSTFDTSQNELTVDNQSDEATFECRIDSALEPDTPDTMPILTSAIFDTPSLAPPLFEITSPEQIVFEPEQPVFEQKLLLDDAPPVISPSFDTVASEPTAFDLEQAVLDGTLSVSRLTNQAPDNPYDEAVLPDVVERVALESTLVSDEEVFIEVEIGNTDFPGGLNIYDAASERAIEAVDAAEVADINLSTIPPLPVHSNEMVSIIPESAINPEINLETPASIAPTFEVNIPAENIVIPDTGEFSIRPPDINETGHIGYEINTDTMKSEHMISDLEQAFLVPIDADSNDEAVFEVAIEDSETTMEVSNDNFNGQSTLATDEFPVMDVQQESHDQPIPLQDELLPLFDLEDQSKGTDYGISSGPEPATEVDLVFTPSFWKNSVDSSDTSVPTISLQESPETSTQEPPPSRSDSSVGLTTDLIENNNKIEDTVVDLQPPIALFIDTDEIIERTAHESIVYNPETGYVGLTITPAPQDNARPLHTSDLDKPDSDALLHNSSGTTHPDDSGDSPDEVIFEAETVTPSQSIYEAPASSVQEEKTPIANSDTFHSVSGEMDAPAEREFRVKSTDTRTQESSSIESPVAEPDTSGIIYPYEGNDMNGTMQQTSSESSSDPNTPFDIADDEFGYFEVTVIDYEDEVDIPLFDVGNIPEDHHKE